MSCGVMGSDEVRMLPNSVRYADDLGPSVQREAKTQVVSRAALGALHAVWPIVANSNPEFYAVKSVEIAVM